VVLSMRFFTCFIKSLHFLHFHITLSSQVSLIFGLRCKNLKILSHFSFCILFLFLSIPYIIFSGSVFSSPLSFHLETDLEFRIKELNVNLKFSTVLN
jgi:hypothetical protein